VPFATCTFRSKDEQTLLYARGRTILKEIIKGKEKAVRKVTNAKAGESPHNYWPALAFDIAFLTLQKTVDYTPEYFRTFYSIIEEKYPNVEWGGNWRSFKDLPHFQMRDWKAFIGNRII
jgi:peptidoglycan L-alanyl-D-glutamate endopeptidase CwlK